MNDIHKYSPLFFMKKIIILSILVPLPFLAQVNIAEGKTVSMSSVEGASDGYYIVDGKDEFTKEEAIKSIFFTKTKGSNYQWVQIDLGSSYEITKVTLSTAGLEILYKRLNNNNLFLAVSDDVNFKNIYNPRDCVAASIPIKKLTISTYIKQPISITPIHNKMVGRYVRIWDSDHGGVHFSEVKIEGNLSVSAKALEKAVKSDDTKEVNRILAERINSGGFVNQDEALRLAIDQKNVEILQIILSNNPRVSSSVFDYALNNSFNVGVVKQLLSSGDVEISQQSVKTVIQKRDASIIDKMLSENASSFTSVNLDEAMNSGQLEMTKSILKRTGLTPSTHTITAAIRLGNMLFVSELINKYGGMPTSSMLTEAIKGGNESIINLLLNKVKPNSEAYVVVAQKNDLELYKNLTSIKNLSDNRSIQVAIDKGYLKIVKNGLSNGGNANDALSYAISKDKLEIVNYLITKEGVDVNPVIDYAVLKNYKDLLSKLLNDNNADADLALSKAISANNDNLAILALETNRTKPSKYLKAAIENNKDVLAKKIIEHGGDPDQGMEAAIKKNKTALVEFFIQKNASVSNPKFMAVAASSSFAITKMLVDNGANANEGVLAASSANKLEIVQFLLDNNADPNKGIAAASLYGHTNVVSVLLENGADAQLGIEAAVKSNHTNTALLLLENDANASAPILIMMAAAKNNVKIVTALIRGGANAQDGINNAIKYNALDVFLILLENEVLIKDPEHMELAAKYSAFKVIPKLVEQGVDINYKTANGSSYIHINITNANNINTVMALLEAGVSPNAKDNKGNSLMHIAAMKGKSYIPIIQAIAKAGANVNALNNAGKTPRKVAKHQATRRAIRKLGGKRKIKN